MLFNSFEFLIFFPTVLVLYFLLPHKFRWLLLLIASYTFYMFWRVQYALILVCSTLIDYMCGRIMGSYSDDEKKERRPWLWISLATNLGILFTFKYYLFFSGAASDLAAMLGMNYAAPAFKFLLPMGISFYTFQTMSYSIDVYHGRIKAERHLGIFALFVTFFPQLVAGPIERAGNLLGQLKQKHEFDYNRVTSGLKLMAWGLFKKVVIADHIARIVNQVYNNPTDYQGASLLIATIFFAIQIYCDFSGYSDMAIGAARVMGFNLMENFRRPYFSRSIKEFWSRWHISLSTWFRDYLYIPLGGNRVVKWRWYYNLFVTFFISGLWHGANWTFLVWGALHGFYLVFGEITSEQRQKLYDSTGLNRNPALKSALQLASTFTLVCLAWVFFRANTVSEGWYIITHIPTAITEPLWVLQNDIIQLLTILPASTLLIACGSATFMILAEIYVEKRGTMFPLALPEPVRIMAYSTAIALIFLLGSFNDTEFIYFQF
jgi:alginate O-acetyltransferase complex protein AlgI